MKEWNDQGDPPPPPEERGEASQDAPREGTTAAERPQAAVVPARDPYAETAMVLGTSSSLRDLSRHAETVIKSGLLPKAIAPYDRNAPDEVRKRQLGEALPRAMMALMGLHELGLGYATGIAQIMYLDGKLTVYGELPGACIARRGIHFKRIRQWYEVLRSEVPEDVAAMADNDEGENGAWLVFHVEHAPWFGTPLGQDDTWPDSFRAVTEVWRADRDAPQRMSFSVLQAKQRELWGRRGQSGKPTEWVREPANQLRIRSKRRAEKESCPEAFHGIQTPEDVDTVVEPRETTYEVVDLDAAAPKDGGGDDG